MFSPHGSLQSLCNRRAEEMRMKNLNSAGAPPSNTFSDYILGGNKCTVQISNFPKILVLSFPNEPAGYRPRVDFVLSPSKQQ